jgi:hypothetical protein
MSAKTSVGPSRTPRAFQEGNRVLLMTSVGRLLLTVIRSAGSQNKGNRQCLRTSAWLSRATKTGQYGEAVVTQFWFALPIRNGVSQGEIVTHSFF